MRDRETQFSPMFHGEIQILVEILSRLQEEAR